MATEIELKARVDDHGALKDRLSSLAEFKFSFKKEDLYWLPAGGRAGLPGLPPSGVRVRETVWTKSPRWEEKEPSPGGPVFKSVQVTYKTKEVRDRIEVNEEREFGVSERAAFEDLLRRFGLEPGFAKDKQGWCWKAGEIGVELSLVGTLGWFLELEILAGDRRPETVENARQSLFRFLEKTGVSPDRIEARYYTELLQVHTA